MENTKIVINPSNPSNEVSLEFTLISDHEKILSKYREKLKVQDRPLDLNTLYNAKPKMT